MSRTFKDRDKLASVPKKEKTFEEKAYRAETKRALLRCLASNDCIYIPVKRRRRKNV